jgi:hypothetical protein
MPAVADRTFSFRAPSALRERLDHAERTYADLVRDPEVAAHISRELEIRLLRRLRAFGMTPPNQGQTLRSLTEAFVDAVETAEHEAQLFEDMRAFDAADTDGPARRRAMQELYARGVAKEEAEDARARGRLLD